MSRAYETIQVDDLGEGLNLLRLNRPQVANAMNTQMGHDLLGFFDAVNAELRAKLDLGPLPRGGSAQTVNNTSDNDNQSDGASFRIIADTADWDRSVGTNTPGQSGDPDSPHYRDLFVPWAKGRYFPVFFSRAKVESVTEAKSVLVP